MDSVVNKYGVEYFIGAKVIILGSEGVITQIDKQNHYLRIRSDRGISQVDIDASNAVISICNNKLIEESEPVETKLEETKSREPMFPKNNSCFFIESENTNEKRPGDNPFMNPYKEQLPPWNQMTKEQRLGILQRYFTAGKKMVLENIPVDNRNPQKMNEVFELIKNYVEQGYFVGGHNVMEYHALQLVLFILLFTTNNNYSIDEETRKRFISGLIRQLDSLRISLFKPVWKWDPLAVILSCGFDQSVIPLSLFVKVWIGNNLDRLRKKLESYPLVSMEMLITSLSSNESLSVKVEQDMNYPMNEEHDYEYDVEDFDMFEKSEHSWQGVLVQDNYELGYMHEYYTAGWQFSQNINSVIETTLLNLQLKEERRIREIEEEQRAQKKALEDTYLKDDFFMYRSDRKYIMGLTQKGKELKTLRIPSQTIFGKVSKIWKEAFQESSAESVIIEEGITSIGQDCFKNCNSLTKVVLPNSLKTLGSGAFCGCRNLISISSPIGIKKISSQTFQDCVKLSNFYIPATVEEIASQAFYGCKGLSSLFIPASVKIIGSLAFAGCTNIPAITIPNSVKEIQCAAFSGWDLLTEIVIPDSVIKMDSQVFENCKSLKSVRLSKNITELPWNTFYKCPKIEFVSVDKDFKLPDDDYHVCVPKSVFKWRE